MSFSLPVKKSIIYGIYTGLLLAIFLKTVESLTSYKVYTLLLNVDYIAFLNQVTFPEIIEVIYHLIISVAVSICLYFFIVRLKITSSKKIVYTSIAICLLIGGLLFPTTALSNRTPAIESVPSLLFWLLGHGIYGFSLGYLFARWIPNSIKDQ